MAVGARSNPPSLATTTTSATCSSPSLPKNKDEQEVSLSAVAALPRQQPRTVARKTSRPLHQRKKNRDGKAEPVVTAAAVVQSSSSAPGANNGGVGGVRPLSSALNFASPQATAAVTAAAATAVGGAAKFAPLPRLESRREVEPKTSSAAVTASEPSIDGSFSSSFSWEDGPDVFVSSLQDGVLLSCDDFSEHEARESGVGIGHFPIGGVLFGSNDQTGSATVATMPLNDQPDIPTCTTSHLADGLEYQPWWQQHQQQRQLRLFQQRPCSPSVVYPRPQATGLELDNKNKGDIRRQDSFRSDFDSILIDELPAEVTNSPISSWTQDKLEAGASAVLAVFADPDFSDTASGRNCSDVSRVGTGGGGVGVEGLQQQYQRHLQKRRYHHISSSNNTEWRPSLVWPPHNNTPVGCAMGLRYCPSSTPVRTVPMTAAVDSRRALYHQTASAPAAAISQQHQGYHMQQQQQQRRPASLEKSRSLANDTAPGGWKRP